MMAQIEMENLVATDWWWDEHEYRVPSRARMESERKAYDEVEREGLGNEGSHSGDHTGTGKDIL